MGSGTAQLSSEGVARTLPSRLSWGILELLSVAERGVPELSRSLGIKPAPVRHYLARLLDAGIVAKKKLRLPSGKVISTFGLTGSAKSVSSPPRNYYYLSEALINGLRASIGEEGARQVLRDIGIRLGETIANTLRSRMGRSRCDPRTFAGSFVCGLLAEMGTFPSVVRVDRRKLIYEQLNCPFQELADKYPGFVCDILDDSVHEGIDKELKVKTTRLKCKGHGDTECRFSVEWPTNSWENKDLPRIKAG